MHCLPKKSVVALASAFATLASLSGPAAAQITNGGSVNTWPGTFLVGPGNTDIGNNLLTTGNGGTGSTTVAGGALLRTGSWSLGEQINGNGAGLVTGAGTRVELTGDGIGPGVINRIVVGAWGNGILSVTQGATLDGRANAAACIPYPTLCNNFIGGAAGSTGTLIVSDANTQASFMRAFVVGGTGVFLQPVDPFNLGTPGGTTRGRVEVRDGALLRTENAIVTIEPGTVSALGTERSFADVVIKGSAATWLVEPSATNGGGATFAAGNGPNSWATVNISSGGRLVLQGAGGNTFNAINLSSGGGRTDFTVTDVGSRVEMTGSNPIMNVGNSLGTANMLVTNGAVVDGALTLVVGRDASRGQLTVDGPGSRVHLRGTGAPGTPSSGFAPGVTIGQNGAGTVTVSNGGRIDIEGAGVTTRAPVLVLAGNAASSGTLNIAGPTSVVSLTSAAVAGASGGEAFNPFASVGFNGSGQLNVSGGGKLLLEGNALSTTAAPRGTGVYIGGRSLTATGGNGVARITGAGSELRITGSDANLNVGGGAGSTGQLTLADNARIVSTIFNTGIAGGIGVTKIDNASIELAGQFSGGSLVGAGMGIGDGTDSTGVLTMTNGARITITNSGNVTSGVTIGGSPFRTGGDGTLNMSTGSVLQVVGPAANIGMSVGRSGTGLARVNASTVDLGGGSLYVGRFSGADGTMIVTGGSTVTTGYVGVGRNRDGDGGTGTLIVNGSTLTATTIEIGANGYLGGNGTIVGNIVNYGLVNPGNSPGTLVVNGSFVNGLGGRLLLEVESDGHGGFNTDHLIFTQGSSVSLAGMDVRFRFLGATDPNAFKASGAFNINQFFQQQIAGGGLANLAPTTFDNATFSAQADGYTFSNFTFNPLSGASFTAAPVPEPQAYAMLLAGLGLICAVAGRRKRG